MLMLVDGKGKPVDARHSILSLVKEVGGSDILSFINKLRALFYHILYRELQALDAIKATSVRCKYNLCFIIRNNYSSNYWKTSSQTSGCEQQKLSTTLISRARILVTCHLYFQIWCLFILPWTFTILKTLKTRSGWNERDGRPRKYCC